MPRPVCTARRSSWATARRWRRRRPDQQNRVDYIADDRVLRHQEHSRTTLARIQKTREMNRHGARVVRDENTVLIRGKVQHGAVGHSLQPGLNSAQKVEGRFAKANAVDDCLVQIGIRQETAAHDSLSLIAWRARSSFAQRSGFASLKGIAEVSKLLRFAAR